MATEVVKQEAPQVPALRHSATSEIEQGDLAFPKMKLGQYTSDHVKQQLVKPGSIFTCLNADDADPVVLWTPTKKGENAGVIVHVLDMFKGKSLSEGGELQMWYGKELVNAPPEAWTTYNYVIAIPEFDAEVPARWLLTRSGKNTAQQINMVLKKEEGRTPAWGIAFEVTTAERSNAKGEWFVPQVRRVDAKPDNVGIAENMIAMVAASNFDDSATDEGPAI